ncbi:ribonuclease H-like domain-containing protein [Tanacetum coccineum]
MVPRAVLMKFGLVSLNTAKKVNTAHLKITVNSARPMTNLSKSAHSIVKWLIHKNTSFKNSNFNQRVNTVKDKNVNIVRPKAVVNATRPKVVVNAVNGNNVNAIQVSDGFGPQKKLIFLSNVQGNPQMDLQDQEVIDSGCSRHMTGNMSYLTDYEEMDGGYVSFGELKFNLFSVSQMCEKKNSVLFNDTECIVLSPNFKLTDESQVLLKVPRKNNMYSVDLKNIVPKGGLTCLFAKATSDESYSKLPTTFWDEVVNTACYVQNRVLVTKPQNKTPYELFLGRKPALGFMRPFRYRVTILNTTNHLGKFDGKANEGFFVGYSINSKAFRVFNSRTRIVEENLHVQFSENTPNVARSTKACDDVGKARMETKVTKEPGKEGGDPSKEDERDDQEKDASVNSTNNVNATSTNEVNAVGRKASIKLPDEPNMPALEDIVYSDDDEDVGAKADINNLDAFMPVSPIPTTRVHKNHPVEQIIGDLNSAPQTRRMTKNLEEYGLFSSVQQRTNQKYFQNSMGELTFFLGLQVKQKEDGIFISQDQYVTEILKKFGFIDVKTANTPMETQKPLSKDKDGEEVDVHLYRSMIGLLMYLTSSRPNIILISWQCKKQNVVANSTTEAEDSNEKKLIQMIKIHTDKNVADLLTKAFDSVWNGIEVNVGNSKLMLLVNAVRHNLLLLMKVNAATHKLTTAGER